MDFSTVIIRPYFFRPVAAAIQTSSLPLAALPLVATTQRVADHRLLRSKPY